MGSAGVTAQPRRTVGRSRLRGCGLSHQVNASSEESIRQVKRLFAAYARMPTADELYSYSKILCELTPGELEHAIDVSVKPREEDSTYRQPTDAGLILDLGLQYRRRVGKKQAGVIRSDCQKCKGTGFKLVDRNGNEVPWSHPVSERRAAACDCKAAVKRA